MIVSFLVILKMDDINESELSEQTKFRLNEIAGIENYFYQEINQQETCYKKLSRYVTIFEYIDKILIILSAVGIESASFTLFFSLTT